jgi:hypothetical protein
MTAHAITLLLAAALAPADGPPDAQSIEFFEMKIRPILVQHCYQCHSAEAKKVKSGLLLDTRDGIRKGGETGPAVVPGKIDKSLLIQAIRYGDELKMPPKGKLSDAVIADFEKWVAMGAPDPRDKAATAKAGLYDYDKARKHWAYQPIRKPPLPAVRLSSWATSPIDNFILAKLEANGLTPSPPADRRTLIRRAYYDLIGLPPTYEEVQAFERDPSPDAFAKVVDRLLDSPHYGERWGRHWLDVARYADTKDLVLVFGPDRVRPYSYTYRDYVIRALNADTPYDRFIHEQLAADQIVPKKGTGPLESQVLSPFSEQDEKWRLAAMGFLTLGRLFDNNVPDILDDRVDTVTRGLLGLTVSCARCHDHKYDAIPTADYYSLYGVFASSVMPVELPLIGDPARTPGSAEFEKQAAPKREELRKFVDTQYEVLTEAARTRVADYLLRVLEKPNPIEDAVFFFSLAPEDLRPQIVARWRRYVAKHAQPGDPVFGPWHDLMALPADRFSAEAKTVVARWHDLPPDQMNPLVRESLEKATLTSPADVARTYGEMFKHVYLESKNPGAKPQSAAQQLLDILTTPAGPAYFPRSECWLYMSRAEKDGHGQKVQAIDRMAVTSPGAPPRAMVLLDAPQLYEPRVFLRGSPTQLGEAVPRQFLRILGGPDRKPFTHGSGRLDLAQAITSPDNPLTARVEVNRVWMHHFGEPLVATPGDFGVRSSPPTHPELLDYLAWTFMHEDGWSLKKLHRRIMLSSAYQQSSRDRPESRKRDPENRWLWRANRRRLDLESMRDSLLAISGRLDPKMLGRLTEAADNPQDRRRTVYGKVDRQDVPSLYRAFDFASPDQTASQRPKTTVPQQALFAMNSPFVIELAKALAARVANEPTPDRRVMALYRFVLARDPEPAEIQAALRFLDAERGDKESKLTSWEQYAQVLLLTNEAMFVD